MKKSMLIGAVLLLVFSSFVIAGLVEVQKFFTIEQQAPLISGTPEIPWLLLAALISVPFVLGLTLSAIIRKRRGLSFF